MSQFEVSSLQTSSEAERARKHKKNSKAPEPSLRFGLALAIITIAIAIPCTWPPPPPLSLLDRPCLSVLQKLPSPANGILTNRECLMEAQSVNCGVLDGLVLQYVAEEHLLEDPEDGLTTRPSPNINRELIHVVRLLIEAGRIKEALKFMQQHGHVALKDQRLLFRLHKQTFIETLRTGGASAYMEAIKCSRAHLGPCALNAYPEAYEEFKRVLLALVYDKDDVTSPVAEEYSEVRRAELAAAIASTLTAQLHAYDPCLSLALRYLISLHNGYCQRQGETSSIAEICSNLLSKDRDPPATPQEAVTEIPKFSEIDVQGLAHAVELPRQGAVDSLRFTGGNLETAFKNELSRWRVNLSTMDELVHEYCLYRGLVEGGPHISANGSGTSCDAVAAHLSDVLATGVVNGFKAVGFTGPTLSSAQGGPSQIGEYMPDSLIVTPNSDHVLTDVVIGLQLNIGCSQMEGLESAASDVVMEDPVVEVPEAVGESLPQGLSRTVTLEEVRNSGICSTSGSSHAGVAGGHSTSEFVEAGKNFRKCYRWRGRREPVVAGDYLGDLWGSVSENRSADAEKSPGPAGSREPRGVSLLMDERMEHGDGVFQMYGRALEIRQLASEGKTTEVIEEVHKLIPSFFEHNPHLLFQLKQVEFLKLVEVGDYIRALSVARADLGPLAAKFADLLKPLKETLLALARPRGEPALRPTPPSVLAAALQVALGASLGIAEPQLVRIMKATLYSHTQWFKLQMCTDPFADLLDINRLKEADAAGGIPTTGYDDSKLGGAAGSCLSTTEISGNQPSDVPRDGPCFDEDNVLTLMEFLALSRGDAIQLLVQYEGSVENVFAHLMS